MATLYVNLRSLPVLSAGPSPEVLRVAGSPGARGKVPSPHEVLGLIS